MTDTLVLKNKLVMPQQGTYLELEQDEMEYVDGGAFIGFSASRDNCVKLFNAFEKMCTNMFIYKAAGILGPAGLAILAAKTAFPAAYAAFTGWLGGVWGQFCSLFTAGGPIGIIAGSVIAIAGASAVAYLGGMIVAGSFGKGFKIGTEISWSGVRWICNVA